MKDNPYGDHIHWVSEAEYEKAVGQLRLQLSGVFKPFMLYGLGVFIPGAVDEAVRLAEDFSLRVRGVDKPLSLEQVRQRNSRGGGSGR